jgi:hypothetical protein
MALPAPAATPAPPTRLTPSPPATARRLSPTWLPPIARQRFLGELGGPAIVATPPYDPHHFVRVDETITLALKNLKPHSLATVAFDLYVLKSWTATIRTRARPLEPARGRRRDPAGHHLLQQFQDCALRFEPAELSVFQQRAPTSPAVCSKARERTTKAGASTTSAYPRMKTTRSASLPPRRTSGSHPKPSVPFTALTWPLTRRAPPANLGRRSWGTCRSQLWTPRASPVWRRCCTCHPAR